MVRYDLKKLAAEVMRDKGLSPELSKEAEEQLSRIVAPAPPEPDCKDLSSLLWCSIDNDDSLDLDQLTYAETLQQGGWTLWIAIADVDALVPKNSPIDAHARANTTSVYTPEEIFPMLPLKLSNNLTSLHEKQQRIALVVKLALSEAGEIGECEIFRAIVFNHAQLAYSTVGPWLEGTQGMPQKVAEIDNLASVLLVQHEAAQAIKNRRHQLGALTLDSSEIEAHVRGEQQIILELPEKNFAHQLIENFMIAANYCIAMHLKQEKIPSLRRVVRVPKRWEKIVELAAIFGEKLPDSPNALSLEKFLIQRKKTSPETFPDLSLTIIKLIGRGEYVVESAEEKPIGHFALAVVEYTHSTAPNRRFPDLIAERQCKAFLEGKKSTYSVGELKSLAEHCTQQEDAVNKVQRHMNKAAAALLLCDHIGQVYHGIITGASEKGTWVRIQTPPIEGRIIEGFENLDVGDHVTIKLESVDIQKAHINFSYLK